MADMYLEYGMVEGNAFRAQRIYIGKYPYRLVVHATISPKIHDFLVK